MLRAAGTNGLEMLEHLRTYGYERVAAADAPILDRLTARPEPGSAMHDD